MKKNAKQVLLLKEKREQRRIKYSSYMGGKRKPGEKPKDFKGTARRYFGLLQPHKTIMILVVSAGIIGAAVSVGGPMVLGDVVDAIQQEVARKLTGSDPDIVSTVKMLLKLLAIYGTSTVLNFVQNYTMAGITKKVICSLRERVNDKLSRLPLRFFDNKPKGDIMSRMVNDIDNISNSFQHSIIQIITSVVTAVGVFACMLYVNWRMTLLLLFILPVSLLLVLAITRRSKRHFKAQWDHTGELNGHIEEMFTGHKLIKIFGREQDAKDEFDDINDQLALVSRKAQFMSGLVGPVLDLIGYMAFILICVFGSLYVINEQMTIGGITAFFTYAMLFMQPIVSLGNITNKLQSSFACAERVFTLLDEEEEVPEESGTTLDAIKGEVEFRNVSFRYLEDKPLIENMNLHVQPGQLVAIVGPTGGGKTTLVNLLMRFYDVDEGQICIDGTDIRSIPRENLRRLFGMVLQDTWLFRGTIRENIAYGRIGATQEDVLAAANAARVTHFINTLPDGFDTVLDEDGTNISQGQRQLLTIARAILADPAILILDEATSSVDTRTELLIQQAMKTLMTGRTNFVIAHRLSTIREADIILVVNHGNIVETGRHEELLARNGFYAELYNSQFGFFETAAI